MEMARITPDDELGLQRILRTQNIPSSVLEECERWTRAYHGAGHSGPLGAIALISIVRLSGVPLPEVENQTKKTIWNDLPVNTRVEAHFFGLWQPAVFLGLAPNGALAVRMDSDMAVRECYPHVVRLPGAVDGAANQSAVSDKLSLNPIPAKTEDPATSLQEALKEAPADDRPAPELPAEQPKPPEPKPFDWLKVNRGAVVWADRDGDVCDAKFDKIGEASGKNGVQTLLIVFDGDQELSEVPASTVTLAS